VAGLFSLPMIRFFPPVLIGKFARYAALAYLLA
jgi:membrane protein YqaA with SNARE-associated domain